MPGTLIRERTQRVGRSLPTGTGPLFITGFADKGSLTEVHHARSMAELEKYSGLRTSTSLVWDEADGHFGEGGGEVFFSRVFGPTPVTATLTFNDGAAAPAMYVDASYPGAWANGYRPAVIAGDAGGQFKVQITHATDTTVNETSPNFNTVADAVNYFQFHDIIRVRLGTSANDPAVGQQTFSGGTDDRVNATDAQWQAAQDRIPKDLGPGQVVQAGRTTSVAWSQLLNHAKANNRFALCDVPNGQNKTALLASSATFKALPNADKGMLVAPWVNLGELTPGSGSRPVPASAVFAGKMAANDVSHSQNEPSAGDLGVLNYATGIRSVFTDTDADDLNNANVNLIRTKAGDLKIYGYRTGADKISSPVKWQAGNARLYMAIAAKADAILERYVLRQIDGRKLLFKQLEGDLTDMLMPYFTAGSLYGDTPGDAFFVDTDTVNTGGPQGTIANGEIHAAIELTMSPMGETVVLDTVRRQVR